MKFERKWCSDEHVEYYVNGEKVADWSYDSHGSDGLCVLDTMFEGIAKQVGAKVEETEGDDE